MGLLRAVETEFLGRGSGFCSGGVWVGKRHASGFTVGASEVGMEAGDERRGGRG